MTSGKLSEEHFTRLMHAEEKAMDAATQAILQHLTVDGAVTKLSLIRVTAALAAQTAGYASATRTPFNKEDAERLRQLKEHHFAAGVGTVAESMKTIGSA